MKDIKGCRKKATAFFYLQIITDMIE